ncbi:MAG: hypothetical protein A2X23_12850 [Chloroflexi bacterium GWC2_73_18]|nr:MAG: hypothetical protein A2X23_12850 [Chloroflexi bacterium GWC2_73_18]
MIRRYITALHVALATADWLSAVALFVGVSFFRFGGRGWAAIWVGAGASVWLVAAIYASAWVATLWLHGLYQSRYRWSLRSESMAIGRATLLIAVATFSALFWIKLPDVSRLFLLLLLATQALATFGSRAALRRTLAFIRRRGRNTRYLLMLGTGREAQAFADRVERHTELGLRVVGHLRWESEPPFIPTRPVLGTIDQIEDVLHERVIDEVAICLPVEAWHLVEPIARLCEDEGKIVRIPMDVIELTLPGARMEELDGVTTMSLLYGPDRVLSLAVKRAVDLALATVALVGLSPLLVAIAAWIRVVDGPPILFRQTRIGLHGRPFQVLKFRTMVPDAEQRLGELEESNEIRGPAFKVTDDPRITRVGRLLRRTSIDELPQLWNVIRGEMSLVGPRPPLPREVAAYDVWHRRRLSMKPGITGLWQVAARHEEEFDRWVRIDLDYIDRWSLWLDLKIMARTIPAVFQQQGR